MAYDPVTQDTFVAVSGAGSVVTVNNQSKVIGNVTIGGGADFLAYDASNSLLYAPLIGNNTIVIINTTLDAIVRLRVAVGTGPGWVAYDPASGTVYFVNREANIVSVISDASIVKNITLQGLPFASAYDPFDGDMYVTDNAGMVFVINGTSNSLIKTLIVGGESSGLYGIAYNPFDHQMYVTSYSDNRVYILNSSQVAGIIDGFDAPTGVAFGTNASEMFVVNSGNDTVSAWWSGQTSTVGVGSDPREVVFEPPIGAIIVTNYGNTTLSVIGT